MAEVKTAPVVAVAFADRASFFAENVPGSVFVQPHEDDSGEVNFWYRCPCGCGAKAFLSAGSGFKPSDAPSWHWNGSIEKPVLRPSVHHRGHWHGWLGGQNGNQPGVWISC